MESLNNYLTALASRKEAELRFEPNNRLRLIAFDGHQDLTPFDLTGAQISMLIFPIIPAAERQQLPNQPEVSFVYTSPTIGEFDFCVKKSPAGFIVSVKSKSAEKVQHQTPTPSFQQHEPPPKPTTNGYGSNGYTNGAADSYSQQSSHSQQQDSDFPFPVQTPTPKTPTQPLSVNPFMHSTKPSAADFFTTTQETSVSNTTQNTVVSTTPTPQPPPITLTPHMLPTASMPATTPPPTSTPATPSVPQTPNGSSFEPQSFFTPQAQEQTPFFPVSSPEPARKPPVRPSNTSSFPSNDMGFHSQAHSSEFAPQQHGFPQPVDENHSYSNGSNSNEQDTFSVQSLFQNSYSNIELDLGDETLAQPQQQHVETFDNYNSSKRHEQSFDNLNSAARHEQSFESLNSPSKHEQSFDSLASSKRQPQGFDSFVATNNNEGFNDYLSAATEDPAVREMKNLFHMMAKMGASDLHLCVGMPPLVRKDGKIMVLDSTKSPWQKEDAERLLSSIMPEKNREEFLKKHDTDFAYELPGVARFRANAFKDRKGCGGVFRLIPHKILTAEELGLSNAILNLCNLTKGLVVVTGPTGSGKSTTLCALIDHINRTRDDHIITIEDPIEFVHENKKCLINQREVYNHTDSFRDALRAALREDPDIILVGEMRDLETISIAIETAETGHLVFGTLHTTTAASTVDRIIDQFPTDRQAQIRVMLSESLRGVIAQTLLKKRGGGRVAALEVLIITPAISNLIREGKTYQIASSIQTGKGIGMVSLNDSLMELVQKGIVDPEEAYMKAVDKMGFEALLKRNNIMFNLKTQ